MSKALEEWHRDARTYRLSWREINDWTIKIEKPETRGSTGKSLTRNPLFSRQRLPDDTFEVPLHHRYRLMYTELQRFDIASLTKRLINHSYDKKISYCSLRFYALFGDTIDSRQIRYDISVICRDNESMTKNSVRLTVFFWNAETNSTHRLTNFLDYNYDSNRITEHDRSSVSACRWSWSSHRCEWQELRNAVWDLRSRARGDIRITILTSFFGNTHPPTKSNEILEQLVYTSPIWCPWRKL